MHPISLLACVKLSINEVLLSCSLVHFFITLQCRSISYFERETNTSKLSAHFGSSFIAKSQGESCFKQLIFSPAVRGALESLSLSAVALLLLSSFNHFLNTHSPLASCILQTPELFKCPQLTPEHQMGISILKHICMRFLHFLNNVRSFRSNGIEVSRREISGSVHSGTFLTFQYWHILTIFQIL